MKSWRKHLKISVDIDDNYKIVYVNKQENNKKKSCYRYFSRESKEPEMWRVFPLFLFEVEHFVDAIDGTFICFFKELIILKHKYKDFWELDTLYNDYRPFQQYLVWDSIRIEGNFVQSYIPLLLELGDIHAIESVYIKASYLDLLSKPNAQTLISKYSLSNNETVSFELIGSVEFDEIKALGKPISDLKCIGYKFKRIDFKHPLKCNKKSYAKVDLAFTWKSLKCIEIILCHECFDKKLFKHLISLGVPSIKVSVLKEKISLKNSSNPRIENLQFFTYLEVPNDTSLSLWLEQNACLIVSMFASGCREKHLATGCMFGIHDKLISKTEWYQTDKLKFKFYKSNMEQVGKWLFVGALVWIDKEGTQKNYNIEDLNLSEIPTINFDEKVWRYTLIVNEDDTTEVKVPSFDFSISPEEASAIKRDAERIRSMMDPSDYYY